MDRVRFTANRLQLVRKEALHSAGDRPLRLDWSS